MIGIYVADDYDEMSKQFRARKVDVLVQDWFVIFCIVHGSSNYLEGVCVRAADVPVLQSTGPADRLAVVCLSLRLVFRAEDRRGRR